MGVKNFFCTLQIRPQKHALSEFQLFTATLHLVHSNHKEGSACVSHLTLTITSGLLDPKPPPLQNRKERG